MKPVHVLGYLKKILQRSSLHSKMIFDDLIGLKPGKHLTNLKTDFLQRMN